MKPIITLSQKELETFLLNVAVVRPIFIWGPPGIGKSSLVQQFAAAVGLEWAYQNNIHPWIIEYIQTRPDHLWTQPPKTEEPFSSPRSWHMLSDSLKEFGDLCPQRAGVLYR